MPRGSLLLLLCTVALGQPQPGEPFDRAIQSFQQARAHGNPAEAAARREEARGLLEKMPAGSPQWEGRVQNLAQMYQGSGRHIEARAVVQDALSRASVFPEWHPARIQLLNTLADLWQQDGNLLKALSYREKAVTALEATPPGASVDATQPLAAGLVGSTVANRNPVGLNVVGRLASSSRPGRGANNSYLYEQLAELYRQLGRPEAAAKAAAKMRSLIKDDPGALANSYAREGDLDQARVLYQKQAEEAAAKPQAQIWETVGPLQSIASLYEREGRLADAAATIEQVAVRLETSSQPEGRNQAVGARLNLARLLQRSGQTQAAEHVYQELLRQTANDLQDQQRQVVQQYANHLSDTERGRQGAQILNDYLANHAAMQAWQESSILFTLSQIARKAGQPELAEEYQRVAGEKQRAAQPSQPPSGQLIGLELQRAQGAVNQGSLDEGVNLALHAIASASLAPDGEQVAWQVPSLASQLAGKKAPEKGEQVYRALFPLLEARSVDNVQPLNQALPQYARFLIGQKDRLGEAAFAIDRYRESLIAVQGADTAGMEQVLQLRIELARAKGAPEEAVQSADELLAIQESLSGATSVPYLHAAQNAAIVYQSGGMMDHALTLHRQIVAIADLTLPASDAQRGFVRINAAMAFALARQFGEAERLADEALTVGRALRPPQEDMFRGQAEQIQKMKAAAGSGAGTAGPLDTVIVTPSGQRVMRGRWFTTIAPGGH